MKRSYYSFANINLLGKCNYDCFFCLGKDLQEFYQYNLNNIHFKDFKNLDKYLAILKNKGIKQIYITGQNTDPLLYKYILELIIYLKSNGFLVGLRTNGLLVNKKTIHIVNELTTDFGDAIGYTFLTLDEKDNYLITKNKNIPNWDYIFKATKVPFRIAIVVNRINRYYILNLLEYAAKTKCEYIQLRKVSTEFRKKDLLVDRECFEHLADYLESSYDNIGNYENAPVYDIYGKKVVLWRTVETSANSMNYFVNGVISDKYEIIKGYVKYSKSKEPNAKN